MHCARKRVVLRTLRNTSLQEQQCSLRDEWCLALLWPGWGTVTMAVTLRSYPKREMAPAGSGEVWGQRGMCLWEGSKAHGLSSRPVEGEEEGF